MSKSHGRLVLAIDLDGVIHDYKNPTPGKRMGEPLPGSLEALERLFDNGHSIIIHTVKATNESGREAVEDWLDHYGVDYSKVTAIKPNADYYIDDRAIKHVDWDSTLMQLGDFGDDDDD